MEKSRSAHVSRTTTETQIDITLSLDGEGSYTINTGVPFFNHLLELFAKHGRFDLTIHAEGDIEVDFHHLVEDTGIVLGEAFKKALGEKGGISRFASRCIPMDESLVQVCVDLSGRPYLHYGVELAEPVIVHFNAQLIEEFFRAFVNSSGITLHIDCIRGKNAHHVVEAAFKGFGRVLYDASEVLFSASEIPSTKGTLT
jgi:imidazoleglycerol-phosphate dehydratase